MDHYPKLFTLAGLFYLMLGAVLGVFLGADPEWSPRIRWVHIHFNLLGFMTMMIAGVSYHVLPRFNARPVPWPGGVKVQFYLQNIGLLGMAEGYMTGALWGGGQARVMFVVFALFALAALLIMVYNLVFVMFPFKMLTPLDEITGDMKVSEVLERFPASLGIFVESGFHTLSSPTARKTFAKIVSIEKACAKHHVDLNEFLAKLNTALKQQQPPQRPAHTSGHAPSAKADNVNAHPMGSAIGRGERARLDVMVGSLIKIYPETKAVFEKHYGAGCFDCPGQAFETVEKTAQMHNVDPTIVLNDINAAIDSVLEN